MSKKSFLIHIDSLAVLQEMNDEQAGRLFKAIACHQNGSDCDMDLLTKIAFAPFKAQFERDAVSYDETIERNRINGLKGGRPKTQPNPTKPTKSEKTHSVISEPKKADSDSDKDSDSKKESKNDSNKKVSSGKPDSLTFEFLEDYNKFLEKRTGTTEQFSVAGRTGLSKIIAYLRAQVEKKHPGAGVEELANETINAWRWVLSNFDSWDSFHQNQLKLEQINSNLLNIISTIKNGTGKKRNPTSEQSQRSAEKLAADAIAINRAKFDDAKHSGTTQG